MSDNYHNRHAGETCLIIGNGPGLSNIPVDLLKSYISFGVNLLFRRGDGFRPHYYVAVDNRVMREHRTEVENLYNVPMFVPSPDLDAWQGDKVTHFRHRPGALWLDEMSGNPPDMLDRLGLAYNNVVHAAMGIAYYMGFITMLCVGLDNSAGGLHFYGQGRPGGDMQAWDAGYRELRDGFAGASIPRRIINLSEPTAVTALERADWRDYA